MERPLTHPGAHDESGRERDATALRSILLPMSAITGALALATLAAAGAEVSWLADLAAHFRVQYAALALVLFVLFALVGRLLWAAAALLIAIANALAAAPTLASAPRAPAPPAEAVPVRVAFINVFHRNDDYEPLIEYVAREKFDALVLAEVDAEWLEALSALEREYPHRYATTGERGRGLALYSRWPLEKPGTLELPDAGEPALRATLRLADRELSVLGVHATWPLGPADSRSRNRQLERLVAHVRAAAPPLVLVGDLNVSPFSPHFRRLIEESGLRPAARGFGWQPTWPTFVPPAGIQIDHILVSGELSVRGFRRGPSLGSDHLPVTADLLM